MQENYNNSVRNCRILNPGGEGGGRAWEFRSTLDGFGGGYGRATNPEEPRARVP
ncbi:hypothetical protein L209DRAFT_757506 [Thermothelomyces heterothallicus CBS 203.75]